jgi:hypothetical protein
MRIAVAILVVSAAGLLIWLFTTPRHRAWLDDQDEDY